MDLILKVALARPLIPKTIGGRVYRAIAECKQRPDTEVACGQRQITAASDKECEDYPTCHP